MFIAEAGYLLSTKLQLSMETGLRPVELARLRVKDLDLDHRTVNPTTAKKGNPRTVPMSPSLTQRLQEHIERENLAPNDPLDCYKPMKIFLTKPKIKVLGLGVACAPPRTFQTIRQKTSARSYLSSN
jgi:integrase